MSQGTSRSPLLRTASIVARFGLTVALRFLLFPAFGLQQTLGPLLQLGLSLQPEVLRRSIALLWQFARPTSP